MSETSVPAVNNSTGDDKGKKQYNRKRKNNKKKINTSKNHEMTTETESNNASSLTKNPNSKNKSVGESTKKEFKPQSRALYKELEKLLTHITPITINGIPINNLSTTPLGFLDKILNDKQNKDEIFMTFFLRPSDPDFPFDIELLSLTLCIPQTYPNKSPSPTIMVLNDDIPRGYSLNIELGFKQIVATVLENRMNRKNHNKTAENVKNVKSSETNNEIDEDELKIEIVGGNDLNGMISTLDKYLEKFLSMEKKDTIKIFKVINKKQEAVSSIEKNKLEGDDSKHTKAVNNKETILNQERYRGRMFELEKFRQRLVDNNISVFKDNSQGTVYKMCLYFKGDHLTLEFDDSDQIIIEKLYARLTVPKEYLNNPKKFLKLAIDMSNSHNIDLVNSITDTNVRLIFGKLINNISKNFDVFSADIHAINCTNPDPNADTFWTITAQLNFFIHNIQKFMNEKTEFQEWYAANKEFNALSS